MEYKATALVSCYNSRPFLRHKIENILESTIPIQIILVDCSGGYDLGDIEDYLRLPCIKFKIIPKRISIWKAINMAILMADAPYVVQANTDDLVSPEAYKLQMQKLDEGFDITYFDYIVTSGYYKTWGKACNKAYSSFITPSEGYSVGKTLGPFPMWRKNLHEDVGYFDENLEIAGDALFWTFLAKTQKKFGRIPIKLGAYAQRHGHNLESNHTLATKDQEYLKKLRDE